MGLSDKDKEIINTLVDYQLHDDFDEKGVFEKEALITFYENLTDYQRDLIDYYSKRKKKRIREFIKLVK